MIPFPCALPPFYLDGLGGIEKEMPAALMLSRGNLRTYASGSGGRAHETVCFTPSSVQFRWFGGWGLGSFLALYDRSRCFWSRSTIGGGAGM